MFKYRFICNDKERALYKIEQMILNDFPCGKSIFGVDMYDAGIHFRECGEKIKGFYLDESELEFITASPIRVCFTGRFVYEKNELYFDVYIYPEIIESIFFLGVFLSVSCMDSVNFVIASVVLAFLQKVTMI